MERPPAQQLPRWLNAFATPSAGVLERRPVKDRPPGGAVSVSPTGIPGLLKHRHQWAVWKYERDARGAVSKPPRQPNGEAADGHDPGTWSSFQACFDAYRAGGWDGLSYAFVEAQGVLAFDLDHLSEHQARDAEIVRLLDSYTEWSPSHDGVHVWVLGALPEGRRRRDDIEIYSRRRFLSVTGALYQGAPSAIRPSPNLLPVWRRWVQLDG